MTDIKDPQAEAETPPPGTVPVDKVVLGVAVPRDTCHGSMTDADAP